MKSMAPIIFAGLIVGYRKLISPLLPPACRFYPSCSSYMEQAARKYGIRKGVIRGIGRFLRCHPWHPGGYDPVN